jgi:hypothetical protein
LLLLEFLNQAHVTLILSLETIDSVFGGLNALLLKAELVLNATLLRCKFEFLLRSFFLQ